MYASGTMVPTLSQYSITRVHQAVGGTAINGKYRAPCMSLSVQITRTFVYALSELGKNFPLITCISGALRVPGDAWRDEDTHRHLVLRSFADAHRGSLMRAGGSRARGRCWACYADQRRYRTLGIPGRDRPHRHPVQLEWQPTRSASAGT